MQGWIEQIFQGILLVATVGLIFIILYQIFRLATGLFLIGLISGLVFIEIYGIYLFFTERYLYTEDLATNGIWSFTGFFIALNLFLVLSFIIKWWRNKIV
ncbi:hypothetical protein BBP08_01590 [Streptococcus agalactiae]|uniref:DUF5966 family protein n=1 Tax=Streptococcus agalactiae TaxID=1311 RepID=UPI0002BC72C2|nr:DUF5966 family protein [Streptococcus agalactiae]AOQ20008.1 hypothetical protein BBP08_01590 [Streptococcus agalactiae]EPU07365.1 membrane protein [Streptococcus agalactiae STIR-CD-21]EPU08670.1 membrane protein [Streptococcus agalactiae STIR-CD-22]MCC9701297.1 hypothetical protein [Streptococcus agalactiae]MCD0027898.1 hypothetical protein [Streptococcus agalactiae]